MNLNVFLHLPIVGMTGLLLLATFLGGLIGWERERHERPAGLRTHILVCLGAALITIVGNSSVSMGGRIAAQIVTGVGFLGAGTIIRDGNGGPVHGLTTAASLWAVAGLGIAIGFGGTYAALGAVTTGIILFTLTILNRFEDILSKKRKRQELTVLLKTEHSVLESLQGVLALLHENGIHTRDLKFEKVPQGESVRIMLSLSKHSKRDTVDVLLSNCPFLVHYNWS